MHQGNWKCSHCGGSITELPFEPRSEVGLTCRTCYAKNKEREKTKAPIMPTANEAPMIPDEAGLADEPAPADDFNDATVTVVSEKPKFEGDWKCADCGGAITSLPFMPRNTSNLKCIDCFKRSRR